jgi:hypothetical protein
MRATIAVVPSVNIRVFAIDENSESTLDNKDKFRLKLE